MEQVYLLRCPSYDGAEAALSTLVERMGGMSRFVAPGDRVLLKVNLLAAAPPEKALSTHPAVVCAIAKQVRAAGGSAVIGDCPGGPRQSRSVLERLYEVSGMAQAAGDSGAELNYDLTGVETVLPKGRVLHRAEIMAAVVGADKVLDLCKLKTHVFMGMTGAVKNHFGILPGLTKAGYHAKFSDKAQFADMLLDLWEYVDPPLCVMDGVLAMEGEGPGASGTPKDVGVLLASTSALALDVTAARLMALPRESNPLLAAAARRGLGPTEIGELEVVGEPLEAVCPSHYQLAGAVKRTMIPLPGFLAPVSRTLHHFADLSPRVRPAACVGCGVCRDACPAKAIAVSGGKARIDPHKCVRCFCCHELCPQKAVALRRGLLGV